MKARIALTDDHILIRKGMAAMLQKMNYEVVFESSNGEEMIDNFSKHPDPDIMLMDINMPLMDGFVATGWLKKHRPKVKVLVLSMLDDDRSIIRMIRAGAKGYIVKDAQPSELDEALQSLLLRGYYQSDAMAVRLIKSINNEMEDVPEITKRELEFLRYVCTELTYKEIADKMSISPRTVDGYRDELFSKLAVQTRVGLVIYAVRNGLVQL